jgi:hypothetical protein
MIWISKSPRRFLNLGLYINSVVDSVFSSPILACRTVTNFLLRSWFHRADVDLFCVPLPGLIFLLILQLAKASLFIDLCAALLLVWVSSQVCIQRSKSSLSGLDFLAGSSPLCSLITSRSFVRSGSVYFSRGLVPCRVPKKYFCSLLVFSCGYPHRRIRFSRHSAPWNRFSARNSCLQFFHPPGARRPFRCAAGARLGRLRQFLILPSVLFSRLVFASIFVRLCVPEYQVVISFLISSCHWFSI